MAVFRLSSRIGLALLHVYLSDSFKKTAAFTRADELKRAARMETTLQTDGANDCNVALLASECARYIADERMCWYNGAMQRTILTTYRYRLDPTAEQESLLTQFAGARRFVWNWALNRKREHF